METSGCCAPNPRGTQRWNPPCLFPHHHPCRAFSGSPALSRPQNPIFGPTAGEVFPDHNGFPNRPDRPLLQIRAQSPPVAPGGSLGGHATLVHFKLRDSKVRTARLGPPRHTHPGPAHRAHSHVWQPGNPGCVRPANPRRAATGPAPGSGQSTAAWRSGAAGGALQARAVWRGSGWLAGCGRAGQGPGW